MSRSYKKSPVCKDRPTIGKKFAKKRVRSQQRLGVVFQDGSSYKNAYCRYNVCDWRFRETWEEAVRRIKKNFENGRHWPNHHYDRRKWKAEGPYIDWKAERRSWITTFQSK